MLYLFKCVSYWVQSQLWDGGNGLVSFINGYPWEPNGALPRTLGKLSRDVCRSLKSCLTVMVCLGIDLSKCSVRRRLRPRAWGQPSPRRVLHAAGRIPHPAGQAWGPLCGCCVLGFTPIPFPCLVGTPRARLLTRGFLLLLET